MTESLQPTAGQTVGPFFAFGLEYPGDRELVPAGADAVQLRGLVLDGAGEPLPDALLELRQAGPDGHVPQVPGSYRRDGMTFTGWGRSATNPAGEYRFTTVLPGSEGVAAPHFAITVFARGLLHRLITRAYLPDEEALATDPLFQSVPQDRRHTLLATWDGPRALRFDIRLQGADETVFLRAPRERA